MNYNTDTSLNDEMLTAIIAVIIIFSLVLAFYINLYLPFKKDRKYIKMEMARTEDEEYLYWKRELRQLYLSSIPLVGRFFR